MQVTFFFQQPKFRFYNPIDFLKLSGIAGKINQAPNYLQNTKLIIYFESFRGTSIPPTAAGKPHLATLGS